MIDWLQHIVKLSLPPSGLLTPPTRLPVGNSFKPGTMRRLNNMFVCFKKIKEDISFDIKDFSIFLDSSCIRQAFFLAHKVN
jgi:hypothetical protein